MTIHDARVHVCFVCMGNICRSPTALGVFRDRVLRRGWGERVVADSRGTHGYHIDHPPDTRATAAALRRGVDIRALRARQVEAADFARFDLLLAMDHANLAALRAAAPASSRSRIELLLEFAPHLDVREVPDPYYGGDDGFEKVLNLIEHAADGLLDYLEREFLT